MLADLSVNIPVFSAFLLLIAGILIGYALWFPFRGDAESIAKQLGHLQHQNEDLHDALRQQRDAYARLERKHNEQLDEWTRLRSSNQRMEAAIREQQGVKTGLEAGVKSLHDETLQALNEEKQKRQKLEDTLRASRAALLELQSANEDFQHLQAEYDGLLAKYETVRAIAKELGDEREQIAGELVATTEALQQAHREQQHSQASNTETRDTVDQLKEAARSQRARADRLQCELNAAREELAEQRGRHHSLSAKLAEAQETRDHNQRLRDTIREQQQQLVELQQALEDGRGQLRQLVEDRDATQLQLACFHDRQRQWQDDLECHQRTIQTIERQRDALQTEVRAHADRVSDLEDELQQAREGVKELAGLRRQYLATQVNLEESRKQLRSLQLDRDEHAQALAAEKDSRQAIEARLSQAEWKNEQFRHEREQLATSLSRESQRRAKAERLLEQPTARRNDAMEDGARLGGLGEDVQQRDTARASAERGQAITAEPRGEMRDDRRSIAKLQAERDQALAQLRQHQVILERRGEDPHAQRTLTQVHSRRGVIYTREPERKDDLTRISGISKVVEERLNEFGIFTYAQVMDWRPAVVDEFSKLLGLPDQITRDNWLGQARRIHDERHEQSDAA